METQPTPSDKNDYSEFGLYRQEVTCPLCHSDFEHLGVHKAARKEIAHDTDLHTWYDGPNPDHYAVIVCPNCWYAAFAKDFNSLNPWERDQLAATPDCFKQMAPLWRDCGFAQPRTPAAVQQSLILALHWYLLRPGQCVNHQAEIWLRLAWLEREAGREEVERTYLEKARNLLVQLYERVNLKSTKLERRVPYLIVELSIRLGKQDEIRSWGHLLFDLKESAKRFPADTLLRERLHDLQRIRQDSKFAEDRV